MSQTPYRISFVCSGNICRSPSAEVIARSLLAAAGLGDAVEVDSYGTGPWEVGQPAYPPAVRVLTGKGYDGTAHVARQMQSAELTDYDLVLALDSGHLRELQALHGSRGGPEIRMLREFDPAAPDDLDIEDPYYGDDALFERVIDEIERSCRGLVDHLAATLPAASEPGA